MKYLTLRPLLQRYIVTWVSRLLLAPLVLYFASPAFAQTASPSASTVQGTRDSAGKVTLVEGNVRFIDENRNSRQPALGDVIFEGEVILTGTDGEVHLDMADGAYIGVRPDSTLRIVQYRAQGDASDRAIIGLLKGTIRTISGWIARSNRSNVVIRTPTATIGIRGTEHEALVIPEGSAVGEPGTYDRVHIGETTIRNTQGTVQVAPGHAGFASRSGVQPRVLERVPEFFRPTRNEGRFDGLHEQIHKQLDQRRQERIKHFQESHQQHDGAAQAREAQHSEHSGEMPGKAKAARPRGGKK